MVIITTTPLVYGECSKFIPLAHGSIVFVCKVYDGDSCTVSWNDATTGQSVRLGCRIKGIDTPEIRGSSDSEKELAVRAKSRLSSAVLGKFVTILDPGHEKYGRVLSDLSTDELDSVSAFMLRDPEICHEYDGGKKSSWVL